MDPTGSIVRRFPLVPRQRPACRPLDQRVEDICQQARTADNSNDLAAASAVFNLAALLASDCGLPDLARKWCHQQTSMYLRARPLGAQAARLALEPIINLARLHIRDAEGERAYRLMEALYSAVATRTDTVLDGIEVPGGSLISDPEAHAEVSRWLWATLLATGARALAVSGRWSEAAARLREHKGIGRRMFDGRQVAVIAKASEGDANDALALLDSTEPGETWENTVTACLTLLYRRDSRTASTLFDQYRRLDATASGLVVFRTQLGISVMDALGGIEHPHGRDIALSLIAEITANHDGYAARGLLAHHGITRLMSGIERRALRSTVDRCALARRSLPSVLRRDLDSALRSSAAVITRVLVSG
ncbi:hypothetical protein [Streptomyces jumonjinensis]|uniref:Uncharacterized protein n=1 Tax=Streptomyces jumonjinensis TaxID=1945 RepID=A0A646KS86_STRJU|nr:hypothetical protein [Streptomyces jumonjinensis]MQT05085.1 hypothetical protein [Streptomyces jumonjinensis]